MTLQQYIVIYQKCTRMNLYKLQTKLLLLFCSRTIRLVDKLQHSFILLLPNLMFVSLMYFKLLITYQIPLRQHSQIMFRNLFSSTFISHKTDELAVFYHLYCKPSNRTYIMCFILKQKSNSFRLVFIQFPHAIINHADDM